MDPTPATVMFVAVQQANAAATHAALKAKGWLEKRVEPLQLPQERVAFPLNGALSDDRLNDALRVPFERMEATALTRPPVDPHERLRTAMETWLNHHGVDDRTALEHLPTKWEKLGELVLLPNEPLAHKAWAALRDHAAIDTLWQTMANALQGTALGIQRPVANDTHRSSQVEMLLGSSEVRFLDHGVTFAFDAAKVMFSSGNNTERRRIGELNMVGETVIDAYAGVGYYTLPMLVRSGAHRVHACEINPDSVAGLRRGAALNGVHERLTVHEGDNAETLASLRGVADRCHLGLLPSSEAAWEACLLALKPSGGVLHVHMNVEEEHIERWCTQTTERFRHLVVQHGLGFDVGVNHLEKVKWFAPRVRHVVLDLTFRPKPA